MLHMPRASLAQIRCFGGVARSETGLVLGESRSSYLLADNIGNCTSPFHKPARRCAVSSSHSHHLCDSGKCAQACSHSLMNARDHVYHAPDTEDLPTRKTFSLE